MRDERGAQVMGGLPRPGKALKGVLIGLFSIWLVFALAINWGGASGQSFFALCGNTEKIFQGQVWRIFTASLLHMPSGDIGHILVSLIGLYFLSPSLESAWGSKRFLRFLFFSGALAYGTQAAVDMALPASIAARLVPQGTDGYYFGAMPVVEAVAIAWALSFRGRTVHLFFTIPVSSRGLILFVVGISLMSLIALRTPPSGHIAVFAGMGAGWLLGGGTPSPLRRFYLKYRLARLEIEAKRDRQERKKRVKSSGLRVIDGGGRDDDKHRLN